MKVLLKIFVAISLASIFVGCHGSRSVSSDVSDSADSSAVFSAHSSAVLGRLSDYRFEVSFDSPELWIIDSEAQHEGATAAPARSRAVRLTATSATAKAAGSDSLHVDFADDINVATNGSRQRSSARREQSDATAVAKPPNLVPAFFLIAVVMVIIGLRKR